MMKLRILSMLFAALLVGACSLEQRPYTESIAMQTTASATPNETLPPSSPLPSLTPSRTLLPPPTFEPPTQTAQPSPTPTITPTPTLDLSVSIPGLHGAESPTPSTTPGCEPRKDWGLTYTVQANDALATIAQRYNTYVSDLAAANCIADPNVLRIGQVLRVPGEAHPSTVECTPWEVLTPIDGAFGIDPAGSLTFNWRGPRSHRNLIRIFRPDGSKYEIVLELRQNEAIFLPETLAQSGTYTWYVYPLDYNFQQIPCLEGGPWTFTKGLSPTLTPTPFTNL